MLISRATICVASLCVLLSVPAFAQDTVLQPRMQGSVAYVSGGIGSQEQQALHDAESNYNLKLLFARQGSGEYLASVQVRIVDAKDTTVLDATAEGPLMLVKLPAGAYSVIASYEGASQKKQAAVATKTTTSLSYYWSTEK